MQYVETPIEDAIEIVQSITCPDKTKCYDGQTCCLNPDGSYGCCPFSNGVCCIDMVSCCPHANICCKKGDGSYSCCPYPEGVCCKDPEGHCCPHFTQCDIQHGFCVSSYFLSMLMDLPELTNIDPHMEKLSPLFMS